MYYHEINLRPDNPQAGVKLYLLDEEITHKKHRNRPLMIVCPGGGYLSLAHKESEPVVARFLGLGFNVALVNYSVYFKQRPDESQPAIVNEDYRVKDSLLDLVASLNLVEQHAAEWFIDTSRVYLLGFSAGSHLVTSLAERYLDERWRREVQLKITFKIRGLLLSYPMLSANAVHVKEQAHFDELMAKESLAQLDLVTQVNAQMPRTFIWQGNEDLAVSPLETSKFVVKLQEAGVACEYHLFATGGHGLALADRTSAVFASDIQPNLAAWVELARVWLAQDEPTTIRLYPDNRE